jgi:crotonobetainyl-CoA:carnitine CoA-transferase CaiB-like acyl-CoA transferase
VQGVMLAQMGAEVIHIEGLWRHAHQRLF